MKTFMKSVVASMILASSSSLFASQAANMYTCESSNKSIQVVYTRSSLAGSYQLNIVLDGKSVTSDNFGVGVYFGQNETPIGTFAYASTRVIGLQDAPNTIYGAFFPIIYLDNNLSEAKFETLFVTGYHGGLTPHGTPVSQIQKTHKLKCKASFAVF